MLTREQYFPSQSEEEQVALFIRRHWMAFLPWIITTPIILLAGLAIFWWSWTSFAVDGSDPILTSEIRALIIFGTAIAGLIVLFLFLRAWMSYYLDVTIVSERRLIDVEQEGIFGRQIAEQSLLRVQDVSARQNGFFQHLLNYGNLYIETAGEQPNFELHNIPRPNDVAKTILNLHDRLIETGGHEVEMAIAEGDIGGISQFSQRAARPTARRHPLEELRPYFPEPGRPAAHHPLEHPTPPTTNEPPEGELKEGQTIRLGN